MCRQPLPVQHAVCHKSHTLLQGPKKYLLGDECITVSERKKGTIPNPLPVVISSNVPDTIPHGVHFNSSPMKNMCELIQMVIQMVIVSISLHYYSKNVAGVLVADLPMRRTNQQVKKQTSVLYDCFYDGEAMDLSH